MRLRLINLLQAAALVAAVARLWSSLHAPPPQLPPAPPAAAAPAAEAPPAEAAAGTPAAGPEGYDAIVARDLFSAARGVVPPAPAAAAKAAPKAVPPPKLTLTGVVIVDGEKSAFLQEGTAETRPRKVREGDSFAGGTVKAIRPDGITFAFGGTESNVPLRTPKDLGPTARGGEPMVPPAQPTDVFRGRVAQPVAPGMPGQVQQPPQVVPGVPRLIPAPPEEPPPDENIDEGEVDQGIDEGDVIDEGDLPPEDFEEQGQ